MIFKRFGKKKTNGAVRRPAAGPSIISSDVVIEGNVSTGGELQIDGEVRGSVRAQSCVIDMQGLVQGAITAEEVFVRGRVIGPIRGVHVHLHAGAHVEGDVINESISIENGAHIHGSIRRSDDPLADDEPQGAIAYPAPPAFPDFGPPQNNDYMDEGYRPLRAIKPR